MKAVQYSRRGDPAEMVEVIEIESGAPDAGEVVVDVEASPINPSDLLTITGDYGTLPDLPAIPGNEGVGRVVRVGAGVDTVTAGDRVFLPLGSGTWRQQMRVPAKGLFALPADADPRQLAMVMINPPTAYLLLRQFATLKRGDWVIQNAANSAVGRYVIELAREDGIRTVNIVRRDSLIEPLRALGADAMVTDAPGLGERVAAATGGAKIALGFDAIGGIATHRLAACLCTGGTVVNYGLLSGEPCQIGADQTIFRDITLRGFWLARWFGRESRAAQAALYRELLGRVHAGKLVAEVEATYPIDSAREALAHAGREGRSGKILFAPLAANADD